MIIDLLLAAFVGIETESFASFLILLFAALLCSSAAKPFSSGLLRLTLALIGVSALLSLFDDGGDFNA